MTSTGAPGELEKVRAFINTLNIEEGTDLIGDADGLKKWLREAGLAARGTQVDGDDVAAAIRLREALRSSVLTNNGAEPDPSAARVMDDAARAAKLFIGFSAGSGGPEVAVKPEESGVQGALGQLLSIVAESMRNGGWERLKACESDECHWAFYDHARNHSGRWCEMAVCGNRMKARAYRARKA